MHSNVLVHPGSCSTVPPTTAKSGTSPLLLLPGWRDISFLLTSWLLLVNFAVSAQAGVIAASASGYPLDINLTVTTPLGGTIPFTTGGPIFVAATSGPAGTASNGALSYSLPFGVLSVSALSANATTSFVPSGFGSANADSSIGSMSFSIPLVGISFNSTFLGATAESFDTASSLGRVETATITEATLSIFGIPIPIVPSINPPPNTTVFSSGGVTVVLNDVAPIPPFPDEFVEAVDISFLGASYLGFTVNGSITIAEAQTALVLVPPPAPVPEPCSFILFGAGCAALLGYRRRGKPMAVLPPL